MLTQAPYRQHPGRSLLIVQLVLAAVVVLWTYHRQRSAWLDSLLGVTIALAGLQYFQWRALASHAALDARAALQGMYRGEFGKMLIACVGFALVLRGRGSDHAGYVVLGFALPQTGTWWLLAWQLWRARQKAERQDIF